MAATNALVDAYNASVLHTLSATFGNASYAKCSYDTIDTDPSPHLDQYASTDFLNAQQHHGVPPHQLKIVLGALYELTRKFSPEDRLMNHTPVVVTMAASSS